MAASKSFTRRKPKPRSLKPKSCFTAGRSQSSRGDADPIATGSNVFVKKEKKVSLEGLESWRSLILKLKAKIHFQRTFVETAIGDAAREPIRSDDSDKPMMSGSELLRSFVRQKRDIKSSDSVMTLQSPENFDPQSFFVKSPKRVPFNSDADSDTS